MTVSRRKKKKPEPLPPPVVVEPELDEEDRAMDSVIARQQELVDEYIDKISSPITGIRAFCVQCMGGMVRAIADCPATSCPLYAFRMGKNTMHGSAGKKRGKTQHAEEEETAEQASGGAEAQPQGRKTSARGATSGAGDSDAAPRRRRKR